MTFVKSLKDTQTYRHRDGQTYSNTDRQIQRGRHSESQTADKQAVRHKYNQIDRQIDTQKDN